MSSKHGGAGLDEPSPALTAMVAMCDLETAMAIRVAATLRLADLIVAGEVTVEQLAARSHVDRSALRRLLRYLACRDVFTAVADDTFGLTPLGECLRDDHPSRLRARLDLEAPVGRDRLAFTGLLEALRTGEPVHARLFGRPFYEDHAANGLDESFDRAMATRNAMREVDAIAGYDWSGVRRVVDVGGGTGTLLAAILRANPAIHGTLVEQAATVARARHALAAAGLSGRCDALAGSLFEPLSAGGDVYLLSSILQDWSDAQAEGILRRCVEAAGPSGRVLIMGRVPSVEEIVPGGETDSAWRDWTDLDLFMLVSRGGRERTFGEYRTLAARAGMTLRLLTLRLGANSVMEGLVEEG